jgi:hypothetical protein
MAPKERSGSMKVIRKTSSYKDFAEKTVALLSNKRGTITDWESEEGRRIYYKDSKYPEWEMTIRLWSFRHLNDDPIISDVCIDSYTIYPEKIDLGNLAEPLMRNLANQDADYNCKTCGFRVGAHTMDESRKCKLI